MSQPETSQVCPSEDVFVLMLQQDLSPEERAELEAHLDTCAICARLVVELAELLSVHDATQDSFESADVLPDAAREPSAVQFEGYELEGVLGAGGMGVVYRARDVMLERHVAIKVIRADVMGQEQSEQLGARLIREARMLARVNHPNVVTIHEANIDAARIYLVMELIEGASLDRTLRAEPMDWRVVVTWYLQVCDGLCAAHAAGVIHRDIKPSNIIVTPESRAVLTDFGLARAAMEQVTASADASVLSSLTRTGAVLGTPAYMPPEQHLGGVADERSDIFALCASLYASLFGERPFAGHSVEEVALNACAGEVRQPTDLKGVPVQVLEVLRRGMARRKEDRFARVEDLHAALSSARLHRPSAVWRWAALGAILSAVVGAAIVWGARGDRPEPVVEVDPAGRVMRVSVEPAMTRMHHAHTVAARASVVRASAARVRQAREQARGQSSKASTAMAQAVSAAPDRRTTSPARPTVASLPDVDRDEEATARAALIQSRHGVWSTAYLSHDIQGCAAALEGLPADDVVVRTYRAQCLLVEGRCDEAIAMYEEAYVQKNPGYDVSATSASMRKNCRPPDSRPLDVFLWDMELFYTGSVEACRRRGVEFVSALQDEAFLDSLEASNKLGRVGVMLDQGLRCLSRSKRDECALARDMATTSSRLRRPSDTPEAQRESARARLLDFEALAGCVQP